MSVLLALSRTGRDVVACSGSATCHGFETSPPLPNGYRLGHIISVQPSDRTHTSDFGKRCLVFMNLLRFPQWAPPLSRSSGNFRGSKYTFRFLVSICPTGDIGRDLTRWAHRWALPMRDDVTTPLFFCLQPQHMSVRTFVREPSSLVKLVASFVRHLPPYTPFQYDKS